MIPGAQNFLDLDRQFGAFGVGGTWRALSNSYADAANQDRLGGYGVLDVRGSWQFSETLRWDLKLQNLLDRDYARASYQRPTDPMGFPSETLHYKEAGRTALLALTWTPEL